MSDNSAVTLHVKSNSTRGLERALEDAKTLLKQGRNVQVQLSAGTYYLNESIKLTNVSVNTLSIIGAKNGQSVISGAKHISPQWQKYNDSLYKAKIDIELVDQLFASGELQVRARYPNYDPTVSIYKGYAADAIAPNRTQHWKNPEGGFVHAMHKGRWGGMHYQITGKAADGNWKLVGGFQNNRPSPLHKKYKYVENVFAELDAEKEWYFDKNSKTLFFHPENGDISSAKTIEAPQLKHLVEIVGTQEKPARNISVSNITFKHSKHTFMETKEQLLRSDWSIYRGGAIFINNAKDVVIKNNTLVDLGGNAIAINRYARNINIISNHISRIGAGAVNFVGDPSAVRSPSFTYNEFVDMDKLDLAHGPKNDLYPSDSVVHDNLIHDIGLVEKQVAGVQLSMSKSITVSHNSIYRVPRAGINASEGTWGGHLIEFNDVFDTVKETGDHGAFNSWGRDRFWHPKRNAMDKLAKLQPDLYKKDAIETVVIRNNRFRCDHGWDIDLDDGSSNYEIYNNVMLNGGLKLREGFERNAYNNILINNALHPHVWFENSKDKFTNNIVMVGHKPVSSNHWGEQVNYNLFSTEAALKKAHSLGIDEHSVVGDPMFIDAASGDYRVKKGSKALEIGFKNFDMDKFGVVSKKLKALAETPELPVLILASEEEGQSKVFDLLGAQIKSVENLGEQSALGLPEIAGAMVLSVTKGSIMDKGGIKPNDVILTAFGQDEVVTSQDAMRSYQANRWRKKMTMTISRNQSTQKVIVQLRD
ncbi:PDZ domain-containing protein [Shewanella sp. 10N.7]|uniref:PDZ domain-containing protein n=1 Tax=Shewanella sp. 10N.7 TaxID=2885093 RepID=UPI001E3ABB8D|nr:PDZ domain-containing protein [Shewanella sp. 10N.7]MCC4831799.1 PDZ domain-containing protein [Shewanella sp. 10N.7]